MIEKLISTIKSIRTQVYSHVADVHAESSEAIDDIVVDTLNTAVELDAMNEAIDDILVILLEG